MNNGVQANLPLESSLPHLQAWDPQDWPVAADWRPIVDAFLASSEGQRLGRFMRERLAAGAIIYPPCPFRALALTPRHEVHAVILGQDPYHGAGQAEGLAFSVPPGVKPPPSLRNIFKEAGVTPSHGSLAEWARHGVLLLNASLTVEQGRPGSHAKKGWEALTDALLTAVAGAASPCVYLLWGAHAQSKAALIRAQATACGCDALILQANHPSPLSARRPPVPFVGCDHFAQARQWLAERGHEDMFP